MDGQNSIKETIYQIFDIVFPADLGNVALGINEYQELAESFRKLVDVAVEEHDETVSTYMNERIESIDRENTELRLRLIDVNDQLQEAIRKEKQETDRCDRLLEDNNQLSQTVDLLENQKADLVDKVDELRVYADGLQEQLGAKDEQIAKLTEEINKPKANIVIPSQGKSTNLQQLMEEARNKKVKSALDLALSGQAHRGKVELAIPPSYNGGNDDSESLFQDGTKTIVENSGFHPTEVPVIFEVTPSQEEEVAGLAEHTPLPEDNGQVTWQGLKELETRIEERLLRLEIQTGLRQ